MQYENFIKNVGNTPMVTIDIAEIINVKLFAKLEYLNPTGSVKDRAAQYILDKVLDNGDINKDTIIIESSSGNFGIALASYCKYRNLKFYCVVDSHILDTNELIIKRLSTKVFKIDTLDENGGYLLNRIRKVKELIAQNKNSYWVNQYGNKYNAEAYYNSLGEEICNQCNDLDYVFLGVSSGGTITGVSRKVKERYPKSKVIAVDIDGSVVFGGCPKSRYIPGIGSSMVPDILKYACIDEVITVKEKDATWMCNLLLDKYAYFIGGSSGAVLFGIKQYFEDKNINKKPKVAMIFPDRGNAYAKTVYNMEWCKQKFGE